MRRTIPLLTAVAALALTGCGAARPTASTPARPPRSTVAFPAQLPVGTVLAYAVRQGGLFATGPKATGPRATIASTVQSVAVTRDHRAYVSCRGAAPLASVGSLPSAVATHWTQLLRAGHLSADRSDALDPQDRSFWFLALGRVVYLDFARHVHQAPCTGTECTAALHIDATLQALLPASAALCGFIAAHCPPA